MERNELLRSMEAAERYRKQMLDYIARLEGLYRTHQCDATIYNKKMGEQLNGMTPLQWVKYYDELINEYQRQLYTTYATPTTKNTTIIATLLVLLAVFSFAFLTPTLTGFTIKGGEENITTSEDGFTHEGQKWLDIRGARLFERCLKVTSPIPFSEADMSAKIATTTAEGNLEFVLYSADTANNQPGIELESCAVRDFGDAWKSCSIKGRVQQPGDYWICASSPNGDSDKTYHMVAYQNGDDGRTAFWTGKNWQKLDRSSYTIKAVFKSYA